MGYRILILLAALLLSAVWQPIAWAQDAAISESSTLNGIFDRGRLRVCLSVPFIPFEFISKKSGLRSRSLRPADERRGAQAAPYVGFDIDLGRAMARELGVDYMPINTRWLSIIPALKLGRCDVIISGMTITSERSKEVDFSDPYFSAGLTVLINARHKDKITSHTDLNSADFKVVSYPGTTGEAAVLKQLPEAQYLPIADEFKAIETVRNGEADAFIYDLPSIAANLAAYGDDHLVFIDKPFTDEDFGMAIRKNDPDFLKWLNSFLAELKQSSEYQKMYEKWFEKTDWIVHVR